MSIGAALDTLGAIADRQETVPEELKYQLDQYGRNQLAISFTKMEDIDETHVSASLTGVLIITKDEAEMFVSSEDITVGLDLICKNRGIGEKASE